MKGSPLTRGRIILQSREEIVRYVHISVMRISAQIRRTTDQGERYRVRGQRSVPARVTEMPLALTKNDCRIPIVFMVIYRP